MGEYLLPIPARTKGLDISAHYKPYVPIDTSKKDADLFISSEGENSGWIKLSHHHGRSAIDARINDSVIFSDYFGILYGSISKKGVNVSDLKVRKDGCYKFGVRVNGLMDNVGLDEAMAVSDLFRRNGIQTESILKVEELLELPLGLGCLNIEDWKWEIIRREYNAQNPLAHNIEEYFLSTKFITVTRAQQVGERVEDFYHKEVDQLINDVEPVFKWINACYKIKNQKTLLPVDIDLDFSGEVTPEKVWKYLSMWLPVQMGNTLAKIHSLGYIHGYPHMQNFSATGGLYDLDSVKGVITVGSEPSQFDFHEEISKLDMNICINYWSWVNYIFQNVFPLVNIKEVFDYSYMSAFVREKLHREPTPKDFDLSKKICEDLLLTYKKAYVDEQLTRVCNSNNRNLEFAKGRKLNFASSS